MTQPLAPTPRIPSRRWPGRPRRRGYVLVMTLLLLALAGLILVGIARHSLALAQEAIESERDLQDRWGALSLEHALFARADDLLSPPADVQAPAARPAPRRAGELRLGGTTYRFLLGNESAKLNLNTALRLRDPEAVRGVLAELADQPLPIVLRPATDEASPPFSSWGQVVAYDQLPEGEVPERLLSGTLHVTCWGNGRLKLTSADPRTIAALCRLARVPPHRGRQLVQVVEAHPEYKLPELLAAAQLDERELARLRPHLTDRPETYSLWLVSMQGARRACRFSVAEQGLGGARRTKRFTW